jgi:predicted amidohydrolase YtcJ
MNGRGSQMMLLKADTILTNGAVLIGAADGVAEAVALWNGHVLATGKASEMSALKGASTRVIDLAGRLAMPGLHEAHMHLLPLGLMMADVDVRPRFARTLDDLLKAIKAKADTLKPGEWVLARGYDQFELDVKRHPHLSELDAVAPNNPVYLVRACGHLSVVNTMAFEMAGVTTETPVPQGGAIEQVQGRLTGLLAETGRDPIKKVLPAPSPEMLVAAIERAGRYCNRFGITSCMDAAVGMRAGYDEIIAYRQAALSGRMPIRTNQCLLGGPGGIAERCFAEGLVTGFGDAMLSVGPVKIFTDGSAGGRTAAMSSTYLGEPETLGLSLLTDAEMNEWTLDYHAKGYQLAIHAIGDAAIEQTLRAMEKALARYPDPHRRHRIEHCGFNTDDQMTRMRAAGIEPAPQPVFIHDFGDLYVSVVGETRAHQSYPMRTWLKRGFKPSASSDAPVCDANPFPNIYTMLTRKTSRGTVIGADETLTIIEALQAYTEFGAYANRCEQHRGKLLPGMAADIAVFSRDMLSATPEQIRDETTCDLTLLGGQPVHDAHGIWRH